MEFKSYLICLAEIIVTLLIIGPIAIGLYKVAINAKLTAQSAFISVLIKTIAEAKKRVTNTDKIEED